jgi:hypothetical protein|tara:strand:+ start:384 stop:611 length:228 start_codon:yes stop_codon:yes gene_type:complete
MKESKLIEMQNRIAKIGEVLNELIQKLQQVDQLAKGTLTAFQLSIGKEEWDKLVEELKDVESRPKQEEKKFEDVE